MFAALILSTIVPFLPAELQDKAQEFKSQFTSAVRDGDKGEIVRLIRRNKEPCVSVFINMAQTRALVPSNENNAWVDAFVEGWSEAYRSGFARNYDRYLQRLDDRMLKLREQALTQLLPAVNQTHLKAFDSNDPTDWHRVQIEVEALIKALESCGDLYFMAFAYNIKANSWNKLYYESGGKDEKALEYYEKYLAARDRLDLKNDLNYSQVKRVASETRARLGIADPETGEVKKPTYPPEKILPGEGKEWQVINLEPVVDETRGTILHPGDYNDLDYHTWMIGNVGKVGENNALPGLDPQVRVHRTGPTEIALDCGGEQTEPFRIRNKPTIVTYKRKHKDGTIDEHALHIAAGLERDNFQGASLNLAPNDNQITIFYRSAAAREGKSEYGPVFVYDLNGDGLFGAPELKQFGIYGMDKDDQVQHLFDSIRIGKGKRSMPWSKWVPTDKGVWLEVDTQDFDIGGQIKLIEANPKLGKVKLVWKGLKGVKPTSLVFKSVHSQTKGLVVDLMSGKGGMDLPIGRYEMVHGTVQDARRGGKAMVLPPSGKKITLVIEEGETANLQLGSPFKLAARPRMEGQNVVIEGASVCVTGTAGERYVRMVGEGLSGAKVFVKGGKGDDLPAPTVESINGDWNTAFHPLDLILQVGKSDGVPPIRLNLKKHAWFGKLDSGWIE